MEALLYLLLGMLAGSILTWIWMRHKTTIQYADYQAQIIKLTADKQLAETRLHDKEKDWLQLRNQLQEQFRQIAGEILEEKGKKIAGANQEQIALLLTPLQQRLYEFQRKVEEVYDKESKQRFALEKEIRQLHELNQQITKEANNLTQALRGQAKMRGNWGEMILESILEKSGLEREREYYLQVSLNNSDGKRLQPDVVVTLPEGKYFVIDAKVSLNAYEQYIAAEAEQQRQHYLREHIQSVRRHIQELSQKNYQQWIDKGSPDFVLMFMPIEPAFHLAVQHDSELFFWAFERQVIPVSASTLMATLRTAATLWRLDKQNKNAEEIAREGGALYEKLVNFVADFQKIGNEIQQMRTVYEQAFAKLSSGKGNLIARAEKMRKLGIKTSKLLPESLFNQQEEEK
ncbi:MAG: DNA recombination protein RmuC [Cytophagales bacterium]|nr:DNA recombination protein RmuC [Bernardetiaceae bacterium]MDW8205160.1 DNA recombination protein RmuC [Cytophagales bacterium]